MPNYEQVNNADTRPAGDRSPIEKFKVPGQEAEGIFHGLRPGKYKKLDGTPEFLIQIGDRVFGSSTVLDDQFGSIAVGTQVKVVYKGLRQPMGGGGKKPYKDFDIFVDRGPQQAPAASPGTAENEREFAFDSLLSRIQAQKGATIANALKAAVLSMTTTPEGALAELQSAAAQVGVTDAEVPF